MAINYPTSLDDFTNPSSTDKQNTVSHSSQHANANDAIEALEAKVGVDNSSVDTSLDYLIKTLRAIKSNPPGDDSARGDMVDDIVAGESLSFGDIVYLKSDGKWWKADADFAAKATFVGFALESKSANNNIKVLLRGFIRNDDWNFTVGEAVYLSTTDGSLTQTQPSGTDDVIKIIGYAIHADRMYFNPEMGYITHT